jgi:hypothetical protein
MLGQLVPGFQFKVVQSYPCPHSRLTQGPLLYVSFVTLEGNYFICILFSVLELYNVDHRSIKMIFTLYSPCILIQLAVL